MAGARLSSFKRGGGFLNNVDGVITGYQFTDEFPGGDSGSKKKKGDFNALYCILSARVDGAEDDVTTTLFAGGADDFEISEDGHTLEPLAEGGGMRANTPFFKFLESLIEHNFPETNFPEDVINFEAMIGTRVTFVQVVDEEATKKLGKKKSKDGKKEYNRTDLKVSAVLALPAVAGAKASKSAAAPAKGATKGKPAPEPEADDLNDEAVEALMNVLADADGSIQRAKLSVKIAQKVGLKNPNRAELSKLVFSEEFLGTEQGWSYDKKKQTVSAE